MPMYCPKCGTAYEENAAFCRKCGTPRPVSKDTSIPSEPVDSISEFSEPADKKTHRQIAGNQQENAKCPKKLKWMISSVVAISIVVIAVILVSSATFEKSQIGTQIGVHDSNEGPGIITDLEAKSLRASDDGKRIQVTDIDIVNVTEVRNEITYQELRSKNNIIFKFSLENLSLEQGDIIAATKPTGMVITGDVVYESDTGTNFIYLDNCVIDDYGEYTQDIGYENSNNSELIGPQTNNQSSSSTLYIPYTTASIDFRDFVGTFEGETEFDCLSIEWNEFTFEINCATYRASLLYVYVDTSNINSNQFSFYAHSPYDYFNSEPDFLVTLTYIPAADSPYGVDTIYMESDGLPDMAYKRTKDSPHFVGYDTDYDDTFLFPSDSKYISEADLIQYTRDEIVLIRNEIYARYGYNFQDDAIRAYFESQAWYQPIAGLNASTFDSSVFNDYERTNLDTILNYEREQGWRS